MYYASEAKDIKELQSDYEILPKHGFEVSWFTAEDIKKRYGFQRNAAIYSYNDGEMNPLK